MHDCSSHCSWLEETWAFLATSFPLLYTGMATNHPLTGLKPFPIFTYSFHPLVEFWKMWFGSLQSCRHLRWGAVACKLAAIFRKEKELMWKWLHTPNSGIQSNSVYAFAEIKITLRAGHSDPSGVPGSAASQPFSPPTALPAPFLPSPPGPSFRTALLGAGSE